MNYTPTELSRLLKQSPENIRLWSIEFARHLTKAAAPDEKGKRRTYTEDDVAVLALVADSKDRGLLFDAIHKALDDGERLNPPTNSLSLATHQESIALMQAQIDDVKKQLAQESKRADTAEAQLALLERQLAIAQAALREAYIEIGSLKPKE